MTSFTQLSKRLEADAAEWRSTLSDEAEIDDDLLETCSDAVETVASALQALSEQIEEDLNDTDDDWLQRMPEEAQAFVLRFRTGAADADIEALLQDSLAGFDEVRVWLQERERWDHEDDGVLDEARRAAEFLGSEEWDEDDVLAYLDRQ